MTDLLRPIPAKHLREHWPRVLAGLERIAAKSAVDWIPEDIYRALANQSAFLYSILETGYVVLERQQRVSGPCLFVWTIEGQLAQHEQELYWELERIAREIGAQSIEMWSRRRGWATRGFFEVGPTVYIHRMTDT